MLVRFSNIIASHAEGTDEAVGRVKDVLFDDTSWTARYFVVNTKKWFGGKRVLVSPQSVLSLMPDENLKLRLSVEQIRQSPEEDFDQPLSRQFENQLHSYYGWTPYWATTLTGRIHPYGPYLYGRFGDAIPGGVARILEERRDGDEPLLRSCKEVKGYQMANTEGEVGSISDFFIDTHSWEVLYLVVDTGDWLPGKKVVIPHHMVNQVSWSEREVSVITPNHIVESAPLAEDLDAHPEQDPGVMEHYFSYFLREPQTEGRGIHHRTTGFGV